MSEKEHSLDSIVDFATGRTLPLVGAEANRQRLERFLVERKGYDRADLAIDVDIRLTVAGQPYHSQIDLVLSLEGRRFMLFKIAAGSLGSREREVLAAARLLEPHILPLAAASDGLSAIVMDVASGRRLGGLEAIPDRAEARRILEKMPQPPLPEGRREKEKLIFRTYDQQNVNVQRNV